MVGFARVICDTCKKRQVWNAREIQNARMSVADIRWHRLILAIFEFYVDALRKRCILSHRLTAFILFHKRYCSNKIGHYTIIT